MALLDQTRRSAAVRSISYSHLLFLPRAAFEDIGQFLPQWRSTLAQVARDRREMNSRNVEAATPEGEPKLQAATRSEEHTSEIQSLMRISYAIFFLKKKT